ncbi:MAG TPA: hypothetical protein VHD62_19115 [Opitutaceae bacterium]|nr:hypothetical protein [Opitutaceae bacterium]
MARVVSFPALLLAVAAATGAQAQSAPNPILVAPPAPAQKSPPPDENRARPVSPDVAARLAASAPKFAPPPPQPAPKPEEEGVDLRDVDKPKNGIIRLPKYIVQERKPAVLDERAVHTEKGLTDIAVRRYISEVDRVMNGFYLPIVGSSSEKRARAMYAEDERLKNMSDLRDAAVTAAKSDPGQGAYILRESRDAFMRSSDFGWHGGGSDKPTFTEGAEIDRLSH